MILPNKLISFKECVLAKTLFILEKIELKDYKIYGLYESVEHKFEDINEFIVALDVLFVLGKIEYDEDLQVIKYVEENNM